MNLRVVSTTHIPLSFFSKDVVKDRDRKLLEICGYNPNEVDKFDKSPDALKYDARKISEEHRNIIRVTARQVAEKGQYAISVDHKATLNTKGDPEAHSCGVVLIRTNENFHRTFYLLDYVPASETNVEATVDLVREVLEVRNFLYLLSNWLTHFFVMNHQSTSFSFSDIIYSRLLKKDLFQWSVIPKLYQLLKNSHQRPWLSTVVCTI